MTVATFQQISTALSLWQAGEWQQGIEVLNFDIEKVVGLHGKDFQNAVKLGNAVFYATLWVKNPCAEFKAVNREMALSNLEELHKVAVAALTPVERMVIAFGGIKAPAAFLTQHLPQTDMPLLERLTRTRELLEAGQVDEAASLIDWNGDIYDEALSGDERYEAVSRNRIATYIRGSIGFTDVIYDEMHLPISKQGRWIAKVQVKENDLTEKFRSTYKTQRRINTAA